MLANPPDLNHVLSGLSVNDIESKQDMDIFEAQQAVSLDRISYVAWRVNCESTK